jgi:hypothetical protein
MSVRVSALLLITLSIRSLDAQAEDTTNAQNNPESCQVIGAIARAEWKGDARPSAPLYYSSFGTNCNWKALGLPQPVIAKSGDDPPRFFDISPPVYSGDGLQATVGWGYGGNQSAQGQSEKWFYTGSKCTAEKRDGEWQFVSCKIIYTNYGTKADRRISWQREHFRSFHARPYEIPYSRVRKSI